MSPRTSGKQFSVVQRISGDVSLVVKQTIDAEREVVIVVARVALPVQDELNDSGTNVGVEERRLVEVKAKRRRFG